MLNPFRKVFQGLIRQPKKDVESEFAKRFPNAINVEWTLGAISDEAIFYDEGHETIARFDKKADLIDYKINLDIKTLPEQVKKTALQHGEIMNAISIFKPAGLEAYEIIFRDKELTRFTMLTSPQGTVLGIQLL